MSYERTKIGMLLLIGLGVTQIMRQLNDITDLLFAILKVWSK